VHFSAEKKLKNTVHGVKARRNMVKSLQRNKQWLAMKLLSKQQQTLNSPLI